MRSKNRSNSLLYASVIAVAAVSGLHSPAQQPKVTQPLKGYTAPASKPASAPQQASEGQRIFDQQCSRCHATPEGFRPTISGTVVRHMRVRASLSEHDEKELLRFFNP